MAKLEVNIVNIEGQTIYGVWKNSNDKTISTDIDKLSQKYCDLVSLDKGSVLPYFVLSRNYNEESRDFEMFIGSTMEKDNLASFKLVAGEYAKITIKPKLGFLWGPAIGEAKRYFYRKWLPKSSYKPLNMEYELHTKRSTDKHPTVDIVFAIERKA